MATGDFISQYTGEQIEQAIAAYLNGNTKTAVTFDVSATATSWKTNSSSGSFSAQYYTEIATSGSFYVGNYPDIFIVDSSGAKIIPDVDYSAKNGTFKVYSNIMIAGVVVINGMKTTSQMITFTVRDGSPTRYTERFTRSVNYGDNFYTVFSSAIDGLKCDSLTSKVSEDGGESSLYSFELGREPIGSDVISPGGIYYVITG